MHLHCLLICSSHFSLLPCCLWSEIWRLLGFKVHTVWERRILQISKYEYRKSNSAQSMILSCKKNKLCTLSADYLLWMRYCHKFYCNPECGIYAMATKSNCPVFPVTEACRNKSSFLHMALSKLHSPCLHTCPECEAEGYIWSTVIVQPLPLIKPWTQQCACS